MKKVLALSVIVLSLVVFSASPAVAIQTSNTDDVSTSDCTYDIGTLNEDPSTSDCTYDSGVSILCSGGDDDDGSSC